MPVLQSIGRRFARIPIAMAAALRPRHPNLHFGHWHKNCPNMPSNRAPADVLAVRLAATSMRMDRRTLSFPGVIRTNVF
jgi:hypothetical protein